MASHGPVDGSDSPTNNLLVWDDIQVKIQSLTSPVSTHRLSFVDLQGEKGDPSLTQLQHAILNLYNASATTSAASNSAAADSHSPSLLDLKCNLSLSYLDAQGDLVPLTSQDEWAHAIQQRKQASEDAHSAPRNNTLLVFAQVLQLQPPPLPIPVEPHDGNGNGNGNSHLEERLAHIEKLLTQNVMANQQNDEVGSPAARCKDYRSLVKEQQAKIQSRLNKVKTMNAGIVSSNPATPNRRSSTPPDINRVTSTAPTLVGAPITVLPAGDSDTLQEFLQKLIRERQEGMQQLMDARSNDIKAWAQAQQDFRATIQQAMTEFEAKIDSKLDEKLSEHKVQFQRNVRQFEQITSEAIARSEASSSSVVSPPVAGDRQRSRSRVRSRGRSPGVVGSVNISTNTSGVSGSIEHKLDNMHERLDGIEKHILRQPERQAVAQQSASKTAADTSSSVSTEAIAAAVQQQLGTFKSQLDNLIQIRMNIVEQRIQQATGSGAQNGGSVDETPTKEDMVAMKQQIENTIQIRLNILEQRIMANSKNGNASSSADIDLQEQLAGFKNQIENTIQIRLNILEQRIMANSNSNVSSSGDANLQEQLAGFKKQIDNLIQVRMNILEQRIQKSSSVAVGGDNNNNNNRRIEGQLETFKNQIKNLLLKRLNTMERRMDIVASKIAVNDFVHSNTASSSSGDTATSISKEAQEDLLESFKQKVDNVIQIRMNILEQKLQQSASTSRSVSASPTETTPPPDLQEQLEQFKNQIKNLLLIRMNMIDKRLEVVASKITMNDMSGSMSGSFRHDAAPPIDLHGQLETFKNQIKNLLLIRMNMVDKRLDVVASKLAMNDMSGSAREAVPPIDLQEQLESFKNQIKNLLLIRMNVVDKRLDIVASKIAINDFSHSLASAANLSKEAQEEVVEALMQRLSAFITANDSESANSFQSQLNSLGTQLNNTIQVRMNILEQRIMQMSTVESSSRAVASTPPSTSNSAALVASSELNSKLDAFKQQIDGLIQVRMNMIEQRMSSLRDSSPDVDGKLDAFKRQIDGLIQVRMNMIEQRMSSLVGSDPGVDGNVDGKLDAFKQQIDALIQVRMNMMEQRMSSLVRSSPDVDSKLDAFKQQLDGLIQIRMNMIEQRFGSMLKSSTSVPSTAQVATSARFDLDQKLDTFKQQIDGLIQVRMNLIEQRMTSFAGNSRALPSSMAAVATPLSIDLQDQLQLFKAQLDSLIQVRMNLMEQRLLVSRSSSSSNGASDLQEQLQGVTQKLDNVLQIRMNLMEQRLQSLMVQSSQVKPDTINNNNLQDQLDGLKRQMDNLIQIRMNILEQKMQVLVRPPTNNAPSANPETSISRSVAPSASTNGSNLPEMTRTVTAIVKQLMETFLQKLQNLDAKLTKAVILSQEKIQASQNKAFHELALNVAKTVQASQTTIMNNEKQYASALRQTVVRLHNETRTHTVTTVSSSRSANVGVSKERAVMVKSSNRGISPPPPEGISANSWDAIKDVILSSHEELRNNQERSMLEHKNYLVECIELAQHAILSKLTSNTVSESALDESISEMEQRLSTLVEQIQAQATAAVLDRMDQQAQLNAKNRWRRSTSSDDLEGAGGTAGTDGSLAGSPTSLPNNAGAVTGSTGGPGSVEGSAGVASGLTAGEFEDILLTTVEKLEAAMEANCEQIQAQATAVMLDKVESSQTVLASRMEGSQTIVLDKVAHVESFVSGKMDSVLAAVQAVDRAELSEGMASSKIDSALALVQGLESRMDEQQKQVLEALQEHQQKAQIVQHQGTTSSAASRHARGVASRGMDSSAYSHVGGGRYDRYGESKYNEDFHDSRSHQSYRGGGGRRPHQNHSAPEAVAYNRFLEMETRAQQLEHAYECIRSNRPPVESVSAVSAVSASPAGANWDEKEEQPSDAVYDTTSAILKRTSAATAWLRSNPSSVFDDNGTNSDGD